MSVYENIISGLNEAIEFARGDKTKARVVEYSEEECAKIIAEQSKKVSVAPLPDFTAEEIKALRLTMKMTEKNFAELIGVTVKTVVSWENGNSVPRGSSRRILGLLREDSSIPTRCNIVG